MAEIILSNRMQALTDMVTPGTVITDVGCDHGFVSIYLVQKGISPRVIAMDVRSGPLEHAREHIREYGLEDRIETRLSDGLHSLKTGEAAGMICAGMGGPLMEKILTEGREQAQGFAELILQPQSEIAQVRAYLRTHGVRILEEEMILEDGKYYPMMKVVQETASDQREETVQVQVEDAFGPVLLQKKHPVLKEWLQRELKTVDTVCRQLAAQPENERITIRMAQVQEKRQLILEALKRYETADV